MNAARACSPMELTAVTVLLQVLGQDPDAMALPDRAKIHKELYRVLKPGGVLSFHHHWVPGKVV